MKRFNVVISREDGGLEFYPMKQWLRQHPEHVPPGTDPTSTNSHGLRNGLLKMGWSHQVLATEERLVFPGTTETALNDVLGREEEAGESEMAETSFALEYQLRDFIAQNMANINVQGKRLRLYEDTVGQQGIEFHTAVGYIDLLAVDEEGSFYVFELKRGRSPDHAIGQLVRYMGWVKQTIGRATEVNGVIVAKDVGEHLRYAVSVVPNVSLFEYEVSFTLKPANDLRGPILPTLGETKSLAPSP